MTNLLKIFLFFPVAGLCFAQSILAESAIEYPNQKDTLTHNYSIGLEKPSAKPDSVKTDSTTVSKNKKDSLNINSLAQNLVSKPGAADTVSEVLLHPFFGFGIAWGLGSYPVLAEWENALPDSIGNILSINPDTLGFTVKEKANSYNIFFPLSVSYTPFLYDKSSIAFDASFFYIGKSLLVTLKRDTLVPEIDYKQSMNSFAFSFGAFYRYKIDERYFKIDKVDKTCFLLGLSVLPYMYLDRSTSITSVGISDSVVQSALAKTNDFKAWGMGASWQIGVGSQQILSKNSGMEVSISYIGRYAGLFRNGNVFLLNRDINPSDADPSKRLSFISNTFEIRVEFILGKSKHKQAK